ncbi:protein SCARECROW-like [Forsythia ovata]|uniref:Protein SCARECROW-like n=1 Tax=Forsythia ovata TaxID=205694 RepID=A0ABD1XDG5_9LAMI
MFSMCSSKLLAGKLLVKGSIRFYADVVLQTVISYVERFSLTRLRSLTTIDSIKYYPGRKEALPPTSLQRQDQHGQRQLQVGTSRLRLYVDENLFTHNLFESMNLQLSWPIVTLLTNASGNSQYLRINPSAVTAIPTNVCFTLPATIVTNSNDQVHQSPQLVKLGLPI